MEYKEVIKKVQTDGNAIIRLQVCESEDGNVIGMTIADYSVTPEKLMFVPLTKQQATDLIVKLSILKRKL
ncbi:MAG: hypothetical protein ACI4TD_10880 [Phocaeicola sp.]